MIKKRVLSVMLVCLLALGLSLIGCPTEPDDPGGGGGGIAPAELQGNWLRDSEGTERHLRITSNGWGRNTGSFPPDDKISFIITASTGNKIDYHHKLFPDAPESFEWAVSEPTLTISNSSSENYMRNGTYTKEGADDDGFVAVNSITGVPASGTVGTALTLTGTVNPNDATNKSIVWTAKTVGTTGASISGNTLNTPSAGIVTVTATIINGLTASSDFTQDFNITFTGSGGGNSLVGSWEKDHNTLTFTENTWTFLFGSESGTYNLSGTSLTMKDSGNETYTGTAIISDSTVTFSGFTGMLGDRGFGMNGAWTRKAE
jgi:heat shock protein HslJ